MHNNLNINLENHESYIQLNPLSTPNGFTIDQSKGTAYKDINGFRFTVSYPPGKTNPDSFNSFLNKYDTQTVENMISALKGSPIYSDKKSATYSFSADGFTKTTASGDKKTRTHYEAKVTNATGEAKVQAKKKLESIDHLINNFAKPMLTGANASPPLHQPTGAQQPPQRSIQQPVGGQQQQHFDSISHSVSSDEQVNAQQIQQQRNQFQYGPSQQNGRISSQGAKHQHLSLNDQGEVKNSLPEQQQQQVPTQTQPQKREWVEPQRSHHDQTQSNLENVHAQDKSVGSEDDSILDDDFYNYDFEYYFNGKELISISNEQESSFLNFEIDAESVVQEIGDNIVKHLNSEKSNQVKEYYAKGLEVYNKAQDANTNINELINEVKNLKGLLGKEDKLQFEKLAINVLEEHLKIKTPKPTKETVIEFIEAAGLKKGNPLLKSVLKVNGYQSKTPIQKMKATIAHLPKLFINDKKSDFETTVSAFASENNITSIEDINIDNFQSFINKQQLQSPNDYTKQVCFIKISMGESVLDNIETLEGLETKDIAEIALAQAKITNNLKPSDFAKLKNLQCTEKQLIKILQADIDFRLSKTVFLTMAEVNNTSLSNDLQKVIINNQTKRDELNAFVGSCIQQGGINEDDDELSKLLSARKIRPTFTY